MKRLELMGKERDFFRRVRQVIFANPFSEQRVQADLKISGLPQSSTSQQRLQSTLMTVGKFIDAIVKDNRGDTRYYAGDDRELLEYGILFHVYHLYVNHFDKLIEDQVKNGDLPCTVSFAKEAISIVVERGINHQAALRYFALSYQMRRAFFFINQIVGRSLCMQDFRRSLWDNIFTHNIGVYNEYLWNRLEDFSTMLLGETGTGKGMAAAAIGRSGFIPFDDRKNCFAESFTKAFVSLNLSQFPEQLLESELFGHKKGAFTGAVEDHEGIFSQCSPHGAIFLDEIGEVSIPVQIKLLKVLQERIFSPVGRHKKIKFRGRVIAATNRSLQSLRSEGQFRDDFYYRLCSDIISVPPLRQRINEDPKELTDLLSHTIRRILGKSSSQLTKEIHATIKSQLPVNYAWPGNVRELEQCVRRILLKKQYEGDYIAPAAEDNVLVTSLVKGEYTAQQLLAKYCKILYEKHGTYEAVARMTAVDRRTVKKYIET